MTRPKPGELVRHSLYPSFCGMRVIESRGEWVRCIAPGEFCVLTFRTDYLVPNGAAKVKPVVRVM